MSGLFNAGVPKSAPDLFPLGTVSGFTSGVGNIGTGTFGWLNIVPTLQALTA